MADYGLAFLVCILANVTQFKRYSEKKAFIKCFSNILKYSRPVTKTSPDRALLKNDF